MNKGLLIANVRVHAVEGQKGAGLVGVPFARSVLLALYACAAAAGADGEGVLRPRYVHVTAEELASVVVCNKSAARHALSALADAGLVTICRSNPNARTAECRGAGALGYRVEWAEVAARQLPAAKGRTAWGGDPLGIASPGALAEDVALRDEMVERLNIGAVVFARSDRSMALSHVGLAARRRLVAAMRERGVSLSRISRALGVSVNLVWRMVRAKKGRVAA